MQAADLGGVPEWQEMVGAIAIVFFFHLQLCFHGRPDRLQ
jgi:hypothetical protein